MNRGATASSSDSFRIYLAEINQHPLLTVDEERNLGRAYQSGDTRAAHRLITANLRFVVKVAFEYRSYGLPVSDLVQEGNVGLMKAVQKFDPERGIRFISYAVWWIRAYIQSHILKSYSLVKLGTTQAQRKLFFSLARTRRELDKMSAEHGPNSDGEDVEKIAKKLNVKAADVTEMSQRMGRRDVSLDAPVTDDGASTYGDFLAADLVSQDVQLSAAQEGSVLQGGVAAALAALDERERFIVEKRLMSDEPMSLKDIGEHFGFSRERARQLELRAKAKLGARLEGLASEIGWATDGAPFEGADSAAA